MQARKSNNQKWKWICCKNESFKPHDCFKIVRVEILHGISLIKLSFKVNYCQPQPVCKSTQKFACACDIILITRLLFICYIDSLGIALHIQLPQSCMRHFNRRTEHKLYRCHLRRPSRPFQPHRFIRSAGINSQQIASSFAVKWIYSHQAFIISNHYLLGENKMMFSILPCCLQ